MAAGAWAFLARIGGLGAATVSAMLLSRGLTQSEFGRFAVAASVATGGALIAAGGLNRAMLRDIAGGLAQGDKARAHATLRHGLFALVRSIPVGCAVSVLATWILIGHDGSTLLLVAALTAMLAAVLVLSDVLRGLGEYRLANLTTGRNGGTLISAVFAATILPAALRPHTLDGALGLYATACALGLGAAAVTTIYWGRRRTAPGDLNAPAPAAGLLLLAGLPFAITQLAAFLGSQVDLWIAAGTLSATDTGAYAAAFRVMSIVTIPLNAAQITMAAAIPALFILGEYEKLEFRLRRAATVATVPAVGALVLCIVFAAPLLGLLFGDAYEDGAPDPDRAGPRPDRQRAHRAVRGGPQPVPPRAARPTSVARRPGGIGRGRLGGGQPLGCDRTGHRLGHHLGDVLPRTLVVGPPRARHVDASVLPVAAGAAPVVNEGSAVGGG